VMKWWGWGDPNLTFPMADKPKLWPWVVQKLGIASASPTAAPVDLSRFRWRRRGRVRNCLPNLGLS
jgi:hypothetical protein